MAFKRLLVVALPVVAAVAIFFLCPDLLKGLSSDTKLRPWQLQMAVSAFCLSSVPEKLMVAENLDGAASRETGANFETDGNVEDEDYEKSSIYSLLYALYASTGVVTSDKGVPYQFTFNTWGFSPSPFPEDDPQRHGK